MATEYEHKFAQVADDISIHYIDVGPRDATPLVLVHGWPDLWYGWRHQIGPLSQKYRVIVLDQRGFGRSSTPKEISKYGSKNVTGDLARLLDILEIEKAVFIGHDWGGAIVWRMCLYHPDRVLAVCGICTPFIPPPQEFVSVDDFVARAPQLSYMKLLSQPEKAAQLMDAAPRRLFTVMYRRYSEFVGEVSVLDIIQNMVESDHPMYTEQSTLLSKEEMDFYVNEYTKSGFQSTCNYYATRPLDFETERGLPLIIEHKALYIGARNDPALKPEMANHMPKVMPNLTMKIIEEAGHWLLWEQPEQVTDTIVNWIEGLNAVAP